MAQKHGGYRKPTNPAPASGPGSLSKRTDGGPGQPVMELPNAQYGEATEFRELQRAAQLASGGRPSPASAGAAAPNIIPMSAPTTRPGEPVTAGAALGPGPGTEALSSPVDVAQDRQLWAAWLPAMEYMANLPGTPSSWRNYVRALKARLA